MAKGILVSYAGYPYTPSSLMPDNGLASLAGSLINNGHDVKIIDYGTIDTIRRLIPAEVTPELEKCYDSFMSKNPLSKLYSFFKLERIDRKLQVHQDREVSKLAQELSDIVSIEKADFVGFKLWGGDGFSGTATIVNKLRKDHPNVKIFGGGPHAYLFKGRIFDRIPLDALCYDEGEITILGLAEYSIGKRNLESIPNLLFYKDSRMQMTPLEKITDLNSLPMPIYDPEIYPSMIGNQKMNFFVVDESRGCVNSCPFCPQSAREDNRYRAKSAKRTVDEIEILYNKFNSSLFRLGGQMTPGRLQEKIAEEILNRNLNVIYSAFGYINTMRNTDFDLLYKAGLRAIFYGIESGSPSILRSTFEKKLNLPLAQDIIKRAKRSGIYISFSLIYPSPFETESTTKETLEFISRTSPDSVLVYFPGIYPNTLWAKEPSKYGFELKLPISDYESLVMDYKIKNIFPPRFWTPLPYKVGGKSFRKFSKETERLMKLLKNNSIGLFLADEHFIMSLRLKEDPNYFSNRVRREFYSGNYNYASDLVWRINQNESLKI
ncbi:MAG: radical SAM protein [Candidatus Pacearchaeota archaeon]